MCPYLSPRITEPICIPIETTSPVAPLSPCNIPLQFVSGIFMSSCLKVCLAWVVVFYLSYYFAYFFERFEIADIIRYNRKLDLSRVEPSQTSPVSPRHIPDRVENGSPDFCIPDRDGWFSLRL